VVTSRAVVASSARRIDGSTESAPAASAWRIGDG
jgi:hypothetical protein